MNDKQIEVVFETLAEIQSLQVITAFIIQSMAEASGADPAALITAVDAMNTKLANTFEDRMRKRAGLEPRATPREPITAFDDIMGGIDWPEVIKH